MQPLGTTSSPGRPVRSATGVSLIETLVVIGVIGLLLALVAPAIRAAKVSAGEVYSVSNARQSFLTIERYTSANAERYPAIRPGVAFQTNFGGSPLLLTTSDRWVSAWHWPSLIRDVVPWEENITAWIGSPIEISRLEADSFVPSYMYSNSFVAPPAVWSDACPSSTPVTATDAAGWDVRASMVAHPSSKVILWDIALSYIKRPKPMLPDGLAGDRTPMAFADGHASAQEPAQASAPIVNRLNDNNWRASRLHNTALGVLGRDY